MFWAVGLYVLAVMAANATATWFLPLPVFGLVSVGTLVFGVTFTLRDRVHRYGRQAVYTMIALAALLSAIESLVLDVSWRIIVASIVAIVLAETADTEVFARLRERRWLVRVTGSNAVSIPLDSLLFNLIAFGGVFALPKLAAIIVGEILAKTAVGTLVAFWRPEGRSRRMAQAAA